MIMKTETKQKKCQGCCLNCDSDNITYKEAQIEGEALHYSYTCEDCNTKGKEYYYLTYDLTETTEQ